MKTPRIHRSLKRTVAEKARLASVRARFQESRPTPESLIESGEYDGPVPLGEYLNLQEAISRLKRERARKKLSLAEVAARCGTDKAAISRLENGRQRNPTVTTLLCYAAAIGAQLVWQVKLAGAACTKTGRKRSPRPEPVVRER